MLAAYYGNYEILSIILRHAEKMSERKYKKILNELNPQTSMSALAYALMNNKNECSNFLVERKAMVYYEKTNDQKDLSPLFICVSR